MPLDHSFWIELKIVSKFCLRLPRKRDFKSLKINKSVSRNLQIAGRGCLEGLQSTVDELVGILVGYCIHKLDQLDLLERLSASG